MSSKSPGRIGSFYESVDLREHRIRSGTQVRRPAENLHVGQDADPFKIGTAGHEYAPHTE